MTSSLPTQTTPTKTLIETARYKIQAGSSQSDIFRKQQTFMQRYREYYQLMLLGRFGSVRPSHNAIAVSRYGLPLVLSFERYDSLIHRLQGCNVHQRINFRQHAANTLPDWPQQSARLNKMWSTWS
ncbi:hypothetical protein FM037_13460 [Shewanella psychropiezotolerans]|uniref:Orphan protein n=1 Tax=Shewanella psychropiezotolerans TaxID=2593655 RepID=A0ABX5WY85_9GAMM|nr:hypothetical protein [Shewanella psychropiezotolerans]QDO84059.1 hypothetical protein FM037_13460 [Shewanella psychropiezotolerans]